MQKGTLIVQMTKKGKVVVQIKFERENKVKTVGCSGLKLSDTALNNEEVEFELEVGQPSKIIHQGKVIFSKENIQSKTKKQENHRYNNSPTRDYRKKSAPVEALDGLEIEHVENIRYAARSPYNFIPLNSTVVEIDKPPSFNQYHENRFTGYINLNIETATPLYIRDTLNQEELKKQSEIKDYINPDFYSPGGIPKIPGSSLRGMIRTLIEIMSYSRFGAFDDRKLYFRAVGDTSSLGIQYKNIMLDVNDNLFPRIESGVMKKFGPVYRIYHSKKICNTQIYRVNFDKESKEIYGPDKLVLGPFDFCQVYFNPVSPSIHQHRTPKGSKIYLKYALLKTIKLKKDGGHSQKGFLVSSGLFGRKKHMHWVINEQDTNYSEIPEELIREYRLDVSRDEKADIIKEMFEKRRHNEVPCFFVRDSMGTIISFGFTGMFRLAYEKSIGEHIPKRLRTTENGNPDIAEALFGNTETFAGRVFFEDAVLNDDQENIIMNEDIPKLLQSPKPTTFQHYLVQPEDNIKALRHYNENSAIRGNKLYWHGTGGDWIEKDEEIKKKKLIITRMKPVKPQTKFTGRIRFENLIDVELGALLFSLKLPAGCMHKLGMGKPLGLGTIKLIPTLHLSDRKKRYSELFFEWENPPELSANIEEFTGAFEKYVLQHIDDKKTSLWETDRMKELKTMLDFNIGTQLQNRDKTRYMEISGQNNNEFKFRNILPKPTEVKKTSIK